MAAAGQLSNIPIVTNLSSLPEFNRNPLPSPYAFAFLVAVAGLTFSDYLVMDHANAGLWEMTAEGQLLGFSFFVGRMFLDLARTIVGYHRRGLFVGDLLGQVRIHPNPGGQLLAELPFQPIQSNHNPQMLREGIMCDVRHFRRMVALLVMKCFLNANVDNLLSFPFNLFFSRIFTFDRCHYSAFQFFHPIFYSSEDSVKFIHSLDNFTSANEQEFYSNFILEHEPIYGFKKWWESINYRPLSRVYNHGTQIHVKFQNANGFPHFVRCAHHHFLVQGHHSHEVADQYLHHWYPGYCSKILDAVIRSFHNSQGLSETFEYYLIQQPFGFHVVE